MSTTATAPFSAAGWLKMTCEQQDELVRPFYDDYLVRLAQIEGNGTYPYNNLFKGQIPGIDPARTGTTDDDEGTAIYLLQVMHRRNLDAAKRDAFLESGGMSVHLLNTDAMPLRGTIARFGWYSGGTGWETVSGVRLIRHPRRPDGFAFIPKGKRLPREFNGGTLYFRPEAAK